MIEAKQENIRDKLTRHNQVLEECRNLLGKVALADEELSDAPHAQTRDALDELDDLVKIAERHGTTIRGLVRRIEETL